MVNAELVKTLRSKTGAPMMHCKKALEETKGDLESAVDLLRKQGIATAAKKAGNLTSDGLVALSRDGNSRVAIVEMNTQTDFVAKNNKFRDFVRQVSLLALDARDIDDLKSSVMPSGSTVSDSLVENIAVIGENITLKRIGKVELSGDGVISTYVHNKVEDSMGKVAVAVVLESNGDKDKLEELGKQIAMHIAATNPKSLDIDSLDKALIDREKEIFAQQALNSGKPKDIIEKMESGMLKKFFKQVVLLEQPFIMNDKVSISELLKNSANDLKTEIKIQKFIKYEVGESV